MSSEWCEKSSLEAIFNVKVTGFKFSVLPTAFQLLGSATQTDQLVYYYPSALPTNRGIPELCLQWIMDVQFICSILNISVLCLFFCHILR